MLTDLSRFATFQNPIPQVVNPQQTQTTEQSNNSLATFRNLAGPTNTQNSSAVTSSLNSISDAIANNSSSDAISDERCKDLHNEDSINLVGAIAELNEYMYKYKQSAQENPDLQSHHVDDDVHVGPTAQELASNPVTEGTVKKDPLTGFLTIDTAQLSLTEMSILSAMAKRIEDIEARLNSLR